MIAIGVLVALVVATVGFVVLRDDDAALVAAGELFLEPIDAEGPDPFTAPVADNPDDALRDFAADTGAGADETTTTGAPDTTTTTGAGVVDRPQAVRGSEPGLYGGTQREGSCDPEQLVDFLRSNADKAEAFAEVLGIEPAGIDEYVGGLTPVFLTSDTRVTNHGFARGRATPRQSVLQRGTAVMVDDLGVPRVKCYCGNPLLPPEPIRGGDVEVAGERWPGFDPSAVRSVTPASEQIEVFVLVSIVTGERFERPAGTTGDEDVETEPELGTGDVQVTLRWGTADDLDLEVTDPLGETIAFTSPSSSSGGQLDVDAHAGCEGGGPGVENIFWPAGRAPPGEYVVSVVFFAPCNGGGSASFSVTVNVGGQTRDTIGGTLSPGGSQEVYRFQA